MPLMDALSAYQYLLDVGYEPEEVVLLGDSAGGGMVWSVLAYLCALVQERSAASEAKALEKGSDENDLDEVEGLLSADITAPSCNTQTRASVTRRCLGLPGGVIMVSPWVSLPPAPEAETPYPDFANRPQLLNAARCYLARFPVLPERPDPFASDWAGWRKGLFGRRDRAGSQGDLDVGGNRVGAGDVEKAAQKQADRLDIVNTQKRPALSAHQMPVSLVDWLHTPMFARMTSHHPLYSPCSFPSSSVPHPPLHSVHLQHQQHVTRDSGNPASESPFVRQVLCTIKQNKVKVFIMSASGEWFYHPTRLLAEAMAEAGVDMVYKQEQGLIHCENFVFLAEYGMAGRRLLDAVLDWAGESSR
jgi:acetyl esterase/lipase